MCVRIGTHKCICTYALIMQTENFGNSCVCKNQECIICCFLFHSEGHKQFGCCGFLLLLLFPKKSVTTRDNVIKVELYLIYLRAWHNLMPLYEECFMEFSFQLLSFLVLC